MNFDIVESFAQMVREKGIDKDVLAGIYYQAFTGNNYNVIFVRKKARKTGF